MTDPAPKFGCPECGSKYFTYCKRTVINRESTVEAES